MPTKKQLQELQQRKVPFSLSYPYVVERDWEVVQASESARPDAPPHER